MRNNMKKDFDFYEFSGIILPGFLTLTGISLIDNSLRTFVWTPQISVGLVLLGIILSYIAGQLIQGLGNFLESVWWKLFRGVPTDWLRTRNNKVISLSQINKIEELIKNQLAPSNFESIKKLSKNEWYLLTRQIYSIIEIVNKSKRIDVFNGLYGLNRGIATSFLIITIIYLFYYGFTNISIIIVLLILFSLSLYRMHRFAIHYARELFVQFITVKQ